MAKRGGTSTFIGALRHDRITAPLLADGAMGGTMFLAYIREILLPGLQGGESVICDNLSLHKVHGVRQAIESRGAKLRYLPAYSPDLDPIEMACAKLAAQLRQQAARDVPSLFDAAAILHLGALPRLPPSCPIGANVNRKALP